ncbi:hydroxymethylbilane synthase [Arachidicoccus rhizosphaerae]|uniref:Hydroxymethylbilane synthase n=1 Tax=Arachidicoccus rhizosphaerae TaxID=551991 RepID=A0A1H3VM18_9BACT|nr:hydroxymethylbilane synthase [Arachidicoccus rhizosphaerae]SDZ75168.1 hydroxymethylbilane synthase [Arachidicoccus rhizosphaerae]
MCSKRILKIGTRDSKLALWQANTVKSLLEQLGITTELVAVKSEGDLDLVTPLYAMGVQGVFTKTLDAYLLSHKIDVVVHSFKDVPTQLAQGISQGAVLPRASAGDLLVFKDPAFAAAFLAGEDKSLTGKVATGSVRRTAQILEKFPQIQIENLRGNVQTRMQKLHDNDWDAAIFAAAGLERIAERPEQASEIPWMLPAPAQGAIVVVARTDDPEALSLIAPLNDPDTATAAGIERDFLSTLMGGCSTPISAYATVENGQIRFQGSILSLDGKQKYTTSRQAALSEHTRLGAHAAKDLLQQGADNIVQQIRTDIPDKMKQPAKD